MIYGDTEGVKAYWTARGVGTLGDDLAISAALQRASDFIRFHYVAEFVALAPDDVIIEATYEAAKIEIDTPNFFNRTYTPAEAKVLTEVKGIKWEVVGKGREGAMTPVSTMIEARLGQYVARGRGLGLRALGS